MGAAADSLLGNNYRTFKFCCCCSPLSQAPVINWKKMQLLFTFLVANEYTFLRCKMMKGLILIDNVRLIKKKPQENTNSMVA